MNISSWAFSLPSLHLELLSRRFQVTANSLKRAAPDPDLQGFSRQGAKVLRTLTSNNSPLDNTEYSLVGQVHCCRGSKHHFPTYPFHTDFTLQPNDLDIDLNLPLDIDTDVDLELSDATRVPQAIVIGPLINPDGVPLDMTSSSTAV